MGGASASGRGGIEPCMAGLESFGVLRTSQMLAGGKFCRRCRPAFEPHTKFSMADLWRCQGPGTLRTDRRLIPRTMRQSCGKNISERVDGPAETLPRGADE